MSENWNSLKLIRWTTEFFEKKGIPNPRLDAELLLADVLQCKRIDLYTRYEKIIPEKNLKKFRGLVERRARREPLQYIVGETEFWGLKIKVTPDVLIPRPETELLVEEALRFASDRGEGAVASSRSPASRKPSDDKRGESADDGRAATERGRLSVADTPSPRSMNILDIGTGSGCIAIALAKGLPEAKVIATDISEKALEVARQNAKAHQVEKQIDFVLADRAPWKTFQAAGTKFNLIVSNPPYIPSGEFESLQPEVSRFEPKKAVDGGPDGLSIIRQILGESPPFLKPGGHLILEIGEDQAKQIKLEWKGFSKIRWQAVREDYNNHERILIFC